MVVPHSVLRHHEHCACVYQEMWPSSCLKYLNKVMSLQIYKKQIYNWQYASAELAIHTAHVEEHQELASVCYCMHYIITHCG